MWENVDRSACEVLLRKCRKYDTFDYNEARIYRCEVEPFGRRV